MNHQSISRHIHKRSSIYLTLLYLAAVLARFLIALSWSDNPWIMPDEALYTNLARSLFTTGQVLFRTQPIKYDALLYPLLLFPLYGLGYAVDTFRAIQLLNALLINAWVFPMWYLARSVTGSHKSAWVVAIICLLLPDMALSQQVMTENLTYPLTALLFLLAYRSFTFRARPWELYLSAVLCALLYFTKSGLIALGLSLSLVYWFLFFKNTRNKASLLRALAFTLSFAAGLLLLRFLTQNILGVDYAKKSIYEKQTQPFSIGHVMLSLQGMLLYAFFFPACCLILPVIIPLSHQKKLEAPQQQLLLFAKMALALITLGIAYIIYIDELTAIPLASRIHIRYLAAFIPLILMFSLSNNLKNARLNKSLVSWLGFLGTCAIVLTAGAFLSNRKYPVDALTLSPIAENWWGLQTKPLFTLALLFLITMSVFQLYSQGWTQKVQRAVILSLSLWLILANLSGYNLMSHNRGDTWAKDALEVNRLAGESSFVFVAEDSGYLWNPASALDIRLKKAQPFAELDDLIENTGSDGVYRPFVPKTYWTENPLYNTGKAETLVMNNDLLSRIALTPQTALSASGGLHYALLTLPEDAPWIHSALSGFDNIGWVGQKSRLSVFDEALNREKSITVSLYLYAAEDDTALRVSIGDFADLIPVPRESAWVRFMAPVLSNPFRLSFSSAKPVYISTYTVE